MKYIKLKNTKFIQNNKMIKMNEIVIYMNIII